MKKLTTILLLLALSLNFFQVLAYEKEDIQDRNNYVKQLIKSKKVLKSTYKGRMYIKKIDSFIKKNGYNKKALSKINSKISPILKHSSIKNTETLNIIRYMNAQISIKLIDISKYEKLNNSYYKKENTNIAKKDISIENVSNTDKKKVENEIVKLQLNMFNKSVSYLDVLIKDFERLTNYEDKGNFNMGLNINYPEIGKLESKISLNNYTAKTSNFDSEMKGQLNFLLESAMEGEDELKIQISNFIDYISKDGNIYLLIEKLNITNEKGIEKIADYVNMLKTVASQEKYIEYSNESTKESLILLSKITPNKVINEGKSMFSKPMLEVYKKDGDKFLLKPTKYACDTAKKLANKFDPFNGSSCTNGQYKNMLEDLAEVGNIYIKIGNENELGFDFIIDSSDDIKVSGYIAYNDTKILELYADVVPDQDKYINEGFEIHYINKKSLFSKLYADEGDVNFLFNSTLDSKNNFTKADLLLEIENMNITLGLNNNKIEGEAKIIKTRYDWDTKEYTEVSTIKADIAGTTDYRNNLSTLNINTKGIKTEDNKEFLSSDFEYKKGKLTFNSYSTGSFINTDIELSGEWNTTTKSLTKGDLLILAESNGYAKDVFKADISLKNKVISGTTLVKRGDDEIFNISHKGKYEKDFLELNNFITLDNNPLSYILGNSSEGKISGNINFKNDSRYNNKETVFYLDFLLDSKKIIEFNLKNKYKRVFKSINIKAPTNTINFSDIDFYSY